MIKPRSISVSLRALLLCATAMLCACAPPQPAVSNSLQQTSAIVVREQPVIESTVQPQNQMQAIPEVEVRSTISHQDVVWIQERLQDLGYYNGAIDGAVGQATRTAIEVYQQDQGVTPDGQPTAELREFIWRKGG